MTTVFFWRVSVSQFLCASVLRYSFLAFRGIQDDLPPPNIQLVMGIDGPIVEMDLDTELEMVGTCQVSSVRFVFFFRSMDHIKKNRPSWNCLCLHFLNIFM